MSYLRIALAVAGFGLFTVVSMLLGMRLAGPVTHPYNLGTLQYEISPSFSGKARIYVPLAGWQIEAPVFDAPYVLRVTPGRVSPHSVVRAAKGIRPTVKKTRKEVKHAAIWAFIRAFLLGLAGGLVGSLVVILFLRAFGRTWRAASIVGASCFALCVLLVAGSGLWVWQSLNIKAFRRPTILHASGRTLLDLRRLFANDENVSAILSDLARTFARGEHIKIPTGR